MITLQELYSDINDRRPSRILTGKSYIASCREFARWTKGHGKGALMDETTLRQVLLVLPSLILDYIMETGNALRIDELGIFKVRYRRNEMSLLFLIDPRITEELNKRTIKIDQVVKINGRIVKFGGRMDTPRNLLHD